MDASLILQIADEIRRKSRTVENKIRKGNGDLLVAETTVPVIIRAERMKSWRGIFLNIIFIMIRKVIESDKNREDGKRLINNILKEAFLSFFLRIAKYIPARESAIQIPITIKEKKKNIS